MSLMQWDEDREEDVSVDEKVCIQCQKAKPLADFALRNGKLSECKKICSTCEYLLQQERHRRLDIGRAMELQQPQERERRRQKEWERGVILRQAQEELWQERANWYLQQPERSCRMCRQVLPATAFGGTSSANGFILHTRCKVCHTTLRERHHLPCCLCLTQKPRRDFITQVNGYALSGDGAALSLCCKGCDAVFQELSEVQQNLFIRACCERTFPAGQVIYAEVDPVTCAIRYIGRTGKPKRRHSQHLRYVTPTIALHGPEGNTWHRRSNWIQSLSQNGLEPVMKILQSVEIPPLVVEWEQRYIWHGIQQGWELLNFEALDEGLVARIQSAPFNFLEVAFEILVQQHFFVPHGFTALLHKLSSISLL